MDRLKRAFLVGLFTFIVSIILSFGSNTFLALFPLVLSMFLLSIIVLIGIIFDVIGVAATAAEEVPFHAMASNKISGGKHGIWVVRNADRVSAFCNDVVGDIVGTLSGAIGTAIVFKFVVLNPNLNEALLSTVFVALIAAMTVGGKAYAKTIAINKSTEVVLFVGRFLYTLERIGLKFHVKNPRKMHKRK
jgi:CBS domain containing-hemolysin-like protein